MTLLRDTPEDFQALVRAASNQFDMPTTFVEKDYWVTEVLRAISEDIDAMHVVFKGGTSLSKVHRLVRRFSEDVDVLVIFKSGDPGDNARHRLIKGLDSKVCAALGVTSEVGPSKTGVHRTTIYPYRAYFELVARVLPNVKLEVGTRGGDEPCAEREITSYVAEAAGVGIDHGFEELTPFRIRVLAPERTLIEKLCLVHNFVARYPGASNDLAGAGRHFYDIWALLRNGGVREALAETDVQSLAAEITGQSRASFDASALGRPEGGFAASPAFDLTVGCLPIIRTAYQDIEELVLDPLPELEEVFATVAANSALV